MNTLVDESSPVFFLLIENLINLIPLISDFNL